jgi:hypothetical protein
MGFTKHYRAADGGQPVVISEWETTLLFCYVINCLVFEGK